MADVKLIIDDAEVMVPKGTTILRAALTIGIEIPHYCYHPGLSIAGNCRMCLVEVEKMPKPMIACNTQVVDGMVVKTKTDKVKKMQQSVMEFLLINHPLDCPTCDQAGECRLQDYYMQYDELPSRFAEGKVHKDKMIDLGSGVVLDEERCIACTRCVRFCDEISRSSELTLANRGDHVQITTFPGKELSNPYAGNVVDVCPVGALTSHDFRFKKRVWFLKKTSSVCPGCSRGCSIEIHHADSKIYRLLPRFNADVNGYWMCDEGRFGYKSVNDNRILKPLVKEGSGHVSTSLVKAVERLAELMGAHPLDEIGVVGHAGETTETLSALIAFAHRVLKTTHVYCSRNDPPDPFSDDFLITADKNPNQGGLDRLGFKPLSRLSSVRALLVLNNLSPSDWAVVRSRQVPIFGLWTTNETALAREASVVFPIPTFAEQDGHFVNVQGREQKINRAFEPRGESAPLPESLRLLEEALRKNGT